MMDARFTFFSFPVSVPEDKVKKVKPCRACFAKWLCECPEPSGQAQPSEASSSKQAPAQSEGKAGGAACSRARA